MHAAVQEQQAYAEKKPIPLSFRTSLRDCSSTLPVQHSENEHLRNDSTDRLVLDALFTTITNVNFNNETIRDLISRVEAEVRRLSPMCPTCAVPCGKTDAVRHGYYMDG